MNGSEAAMDNRSERASSLHQRGSETSAPAAGSAPRTPRHIAREESILDAMGAFDALGRHTLMQNRDGLTKAQVDIIMRLSLCGTSSMTQIADDLAVSKEHVTRAMASLVERGLVEKCKNEENHRVVEARLTNEGDALATSIRLRSIEQLNKKLASISPEDRQLLLEVSQIASRIVRKIQMR